jgi:hypothetical protein
MENPQNKEKKMLSLAEYLKAKQKTVNPTVAKLVEAIETEQDKDAGKQAVRNRLAVGGKVVAITLIGFEQLEMRGQWVPTMTYIRGSETTDQLVEEVESKGAELPPEQKTVDKEETA